MPLPLEENKVIVAAMLVAFSISSCASAPQLNSAAESVKLTYRAEELCTKVGEIIVQTSPKKVERNKEKKAAEAIIRARNGAARLFSADLIFPFLL